MGMLRILKDRSLDEPEHCERCEEKKDVAGDGGQAEEYGECDTGDGK